MKNYADRDALAQELSERNKESIRNFAKGYSYKILARNLLALYLCP